MRTFFLSRRFLIPALLIGVIYLITVVYLMNFRLVVNTVIGDYSFVYKLNLLIALLEGMWTVMTHTALFILILNSLLTGANLVLLGQKVKSLQMAGKLHIVAGGSSLLAIAGNGCAACGLPILSLLGLGGTTVFLPFKGAELPYVSLFILLGSFILLLRSAINIQVCAINKRTRKKENIIPLLGTVQRTVMTAKRYE